MGVISIQQNNNSSLLKLIKTAAMDAFRASKPCDVVIGTIVSASPLKVRINQKMALTSDFVSMTQTAKSSLLKNGDKVLMFRQSGGQRYYIMDKVVDEE